MKTWMVGALGALVVGMAIPALAQQGGAYVSNEILVRFAPGRSEVGSSNIRRLGGEFIADIEPLGISRIRLDDTLSVPEAVRLYGSLADVEFAEPNYLVHAELIPNDSLYNQQYGPRRIGLETAWDAGIGSPSVVIAIVDTGIELSHPDLSARIVPGWDFVDGDSSANDTNGHGTHCAGIAAASMNNSRGVAGVAGGSKLMPIRVLGTNGTGTLADVASGVVWATDHGARVISMSLGTGSNSTTLGSAIDYAWNRNVLVVAAAGNYNSTAPVYPGYYTNCIAVASTDQNDARSSFSSYGSWVDVAAPGSSIVSTYRGGAYQTLSGTSMAAPAVAGVGALIWSKFGTSIGVANVRSKIESTCMPLGSWVRYGRVNAAMALATGGTSPPPVLTGLTLSAPSGVGPGSSTGTVTLDIAAPSGGTQVDLTSSSPSLGVPSMVRVPYGSRLASFSFSFGTVTTSTGVTISARLGSATKTAAFTVDPSTVAISDLALSANPVTGGSAPSPKLRVTLTRAAPPGGIVISLSYTNRSLVGAPGSVSIPAGQRSVEATIATYPVSRDYTVGITARYQSSTRSLNLLIRKR